MTLHVIIIDARNTYTSASVTPEVAENDFVLFANCDESIVPPIQLGHYPISSDRVPYRSKRSIKSILNDATEPDDESAAEMENAALNLKIYNLIQLDTADTIIKIFNELKGLLDDSVPTPNFDKIITDATNKLDLPRFNIDGSAWTATSVPPTRTGQGQTGTGRGRTGAAQNEGEQGTIDIDVVMASNTQEDIISMITVIDPAIKYLGFDPRHIRKIFIARNVHDTVLTRDLIIAFAAYAHIANNVSKLSTKRVDVEISKKVMSAVNAMGVVKKANNKDGLTLPRLAIAFMPEYLIYRRFLVTNLQDQTDATIDVVYKDIIFHGCDAISQKANYLQFHKEFSALIYKPGEETKIDDEKFVANYNRWSRVTKNGYKNDTKIHQNMINATNATGWSREHAVDQIENGIRGYRADP